MHQLSHASAAMHQLPCIPCIGAHRPWSTLTWCPIFVSWATQTFYEHSIRVPAIMCWASDETTIPHTTQPGKLALPTALPLALPANSRCSRVVSTLDISATLLDALGAPALPSSPGRSLVPLLQPDSTAEWEDVAFAEFVGEGMGGPPKPYTQRMVSPPNARRPPLPAVPSAPDTIAAQPTSPFIMTFPHRSDWAIGSLSTTMAMSSPTNYST